MRAAEAVAGAALPPRLLQQTACLSDDLGDRVEAQERAQQSLAAFRAQGDAAGTADALNLLGVMATEAGESERARPLLEEALTLWPSGEHSGRAKTLHNLARLASQTGDGKTAWRLYEESLEPRRIAGDERGEATTLSNMGALAQEEGEFARARRFNEQGLALRRKLRDNFGIAVALNNLADLDALEGNAARAVALFGHAERLFREVQSPHAAEAARGLRELREKLGETEFAALRAAAAMSGWESLI